MSEPSWIGDDGLRYRTYCEQCDDHHEGDCPTYNANEPDRVEDVFGD